MVKNNNAFSGMNKSSVVDAYLRNIHELRVWTDIAFLPVIGYFVHQTESKGDKITLPSKTFEDNKKYLESLGCKYLKRNFRFEVDQKSEEKVYDAISSMIRHTRKEVDYSALDTLDYFIEYPELTKDLNLHPNIVRNIIETSERYHHKTTEQIDKIFEDFEKSELNKEPERKELSPRRSNINFNKFTEPFQLYAYVLSDVKKTIDFEMLKLYDFLAESGYKQIRSNKLIEVENSLVELGETEYFKVPYFLEILPQKEGDKLEADEIALDIWASNVRRTIDLKKILAHEFVEYISQEENKSHLRAFQKGYYPELFSLIYLFGKPESAGKIKIDYSKLIEKI